jgi:hypothetical protein
MMFINSIFGNDGIEDRVKELKQACSKFAHNQEKLKTLAVFLYERRKSYVKILTSLSQNLSTIDNLPPWVYDDYNESIEQIKDFQKAAEYEKSPKKFAEITDDTGRTAKIVGSEAGDAIDMLGPTTAMSIATVIGTASTGTAISALSGVAATNAALAWLSGGIAGGSLVLLFGPIGWTIAGLGTVGGILAARIKNKDKLKEVQSQIDIIKRDNQNMEPKLVHLSELITRSINNYQSRLLVSINWLKTVQPKDYKKWDDTQKHELEKLINAVANTVQLINERI